MKQIRYFLVNYAVYTEAGNQFLGLSSVMTEGKYINKDRFIKSIKGEGIENNPDPIKGVIVTGINELTEKDYLDWYE
jgi:hypothetical protein